MAEKRRFSSPTPAVPATGASESKGVVVATAAPVPEVVAMETAAVETVER